MTHRILTRLPRCSRPPMELTALIVVIASAALISLATWAIRLAGWEALFGIGCVVAVGFLTWEAAK